MILLLEKYAVLLETLPRLARNFVMVKQWKYNKMRHFFSVTYGGNGQTYFNLPDLRGRAPIGFAQGPGLNSYQLGEKIGYETNILRETNLPPHSHAAQGKINASTGNGETSNPMGKYLAQTVYPIDRSSNAPVNSYNSSPNTQMAENSVDITVGNTGSSIPINNMQPSIAMNWIICVNGMYPNRQ